MKQKKAAVAISMVVGVVMLASAAFANYANAGGYTAGKNAIKDLLKQTNYTAQLSAQFYLNDTLIGEELVTEAVDKTGDVKLNKTNKSSSFGNDSPYIHSTYYQDGTRISVNTLDGRENITVYDDDDNSKYVGYSFSFDDENEEYMNKFITFGELFSDLVVGDLKNNMILIDSTDTVDTYAIDLESYQIPEIINSGLSLIFAEQVRYSNSDNISNMSPEELAQRDPSLLLGAEPIISAVKGSIGVDNEGRLVSLSGEFSVSGKDNNGTAHTFTFKLAGNITNYGTTTPTRIDLSSKKPENIYYTSSWRSQRAEDIKMELKDADEAVAEELKAELESLTEEDATADKIPAETSEVVE